MKTKFSRPTNLNGAELILELKAAGILVEKIIDNSDGTIEFSTDDKDKAESIVAAHNGTVIAPELTVADKLASVGLSVSDLKAALDLQNNL